MMYLTIGAVLGCTGCDLFSVREPETPSQTTTSFIQPVTPDLVLENLSNAIEENNADNYYRCFTDTMTSIFQFQFIPSVEINARYASVFTSWSPAEERYYFQNMGQGITGTPYSTFSPPQTLAASSDTVVYSMNYSVIFPHRKAGVSQLVQGNMQLYLGVNSQRLWSIYRWQDNKTVTDSTWSYWKAVFSGS